MGGSRGTARQFAGQVAVNSIAGQRFLSYPASSVTVMMLAVEAPVELFDDVWPGLLTSPVGEKLADLVEVPAGAWLAVAVEGVDVTTLRDADLAAQLRAAR